MSNTEVKVGLDDDAYEIFSATRVTSCQARDCRFIRADRAECTLKRIYIDEQGECGEYESVIVRAAPHD